jgi:hypothetical protein
LKQLLEIRRQPVGHEEDQKFCEIAIFLRGDGWVSDRVARFFLVQHTKKWKNMQWPQNLLTYCTKWLKNIPTFSIPNPSKILQNLVANMPSGNPGFPVEDFRKQESMSCQMVYLNTQNPILVYVGRRWKILVYFTSIR